MKVLPFTIPMPEKMAIMYQLDQGVLYKELHQHQEVQISWLEKGEGTLIAGDTIHQYKRDDLIVLGGQQPHVFRASEVSSRMHTVFFSLDAFGKTFLRLGEGKWIEEFYAFAKAGLKTVVTSEIKEVFKSISHNQGIDKLGDFVKLIKLLLQSESEPLSTFVYQRTISEKDGKRMNSILTYTLDSYTSSISLDGAAQLAMMTPNAFCKYFKQRTNKTYFEFVNELRINKACEMLRIQKDTPINHIADLCGFQTLSHFNKTFKKYTGSIPSAYRRKKADT